MILLLILTDQPLWICYFVQLEVRLISLLRILILNQDLKYHYFYKLEEPDRNKSIMKVHDNDIADLLFDKDSEAYKIAREGVGEFNNLMSSGAIFQTYVFLKNVVLEKTRTFGIVGDANSKRFNWEAVDPKRIAYI